jgi:hypothetical protein
LPIAHVDHPRPLTRRTPSREIRPEYLRASMAFANSGAQVQTGPEIAFIETEVVHFPKAR